MEKESLDLQRKDMVNQQILNRGIDNARVIRAFKAVPRHLFVSKDQERFAYSDRPLPIGEGQTISQPYMVALMTDLLDIKPKEKILEIGTGNGYQTAILSFLGAKVYSIERIGSLAKRAKDTLDSLGYKVKIKVSDGTLGWQDNALYEKIIVTAAAPYIPKSLIRQLVIGGKIIMPLGQRYHQQLTVVRKISEERVEEGRKCGCIFVPLIGREGWDEFA